MPPISSLIFVVIIASWAAYVTQHWVRRREYLATARSVDRYTRAMHVLERRAPLPQAPSRLARKTFGSPRPAAPDVLVKRAQSPVAHGATAITPKGAPVVSRKLRGLSLIASVVLLLGLTVGVFAASLPWWAPVAGLALVGVDVLWLGQQARAERAARTTRRGAGSVRTTSAARPRAARPATRPQGMAGVAVRRTVVAQEPSLAEPTITAPALAETATDVAGSERLDAAQVEAQQFDAEGFDTDRFDTDLFDIERWEAERGVAERGVAEADAAPAEAADEPAELAPGTWSPVPVPPPTYTLKAPARRRASTADLPFDSESLAFDDEAEELTPVYDVG